MNLLPVFHNDKIVNFRWWVIYLPLKPEVVIEFQVQGKLLVKMVWMKPHAKFKKNQKWLKLTRGHFKLEKMVFFTFFDNYLEYLALLWPEIDKDCFGHTASQKDKTRINHNAKFQRFLDRFRLSRRI